MDDWELSLIDARTGHVGASLDLTGGSWDWPLAGIPTIDASIDATQFLDRSLPLPKPGREGVVLAFQGRPLIAGSLHDELGEVQSIDGAPISRLTAGGLEWTLAGWPILATNYANGADLREGPSVSLTAGSVGTLAAWLVQQGVARNLRELPLVYEGLIEGGGSVGFDLPPWDLSNGNLWTQLVALQDGDGPDLLFAPRWANDARTLVEWVMRWGTSRQPYLAQDGRPSLDLTALGGPIATMSADYSTSPVTRLYGVGAGQEQGLLVAPSTDFVKLQEGLIPREEVYSLSNLDDWDAVQRLTDAQMARLARPTRQMSVTLSASDDSTLLGTWTPGQLARVSVGDGYLHIPAGERDWRCVRMHGEIGSAVYAIELQEV